MDEMSIPDLNIMTKYLEYAETASWERTRQIMLCSLKPYLKKRNLTADEFLPLPCDAKWHEKEELTTEVKNEDIEFFRKYKENYLKQQNKKDSQ